MKNPLVAGIAIGFVFCLLLTHFVCNQQTDQPATVDTRIVDSLSRELILRDNKILTDSLNYEEKTRQDDSDRNDWLDDKDRIERRSANEISRLNFSIAKYKSDKIAKDTASAFRNCDSMVDRIYALETEASGYKKSFDSIVANGGDRRGIDSSELAILGQQIREDGQIINNTRAMLVAALKDNADLRKALARTKKGRWLLMGISAILGGFLVNQAK